ncbi:hypothetical protein HAX54_029225 [Datura stramonium]|uniref:Uncharacterized protein n=1 Tax=Datura stramonium TaxID=4076 RepID=A0ABS8SA57_DATST|nr:hypothetical protein [Datura stramonium]
MPEANAWVKKGLTMKEVAMELKGLRRSTIDFRFLTWPSSSAPDLKIEVKLFFPALLFNDVALTVPASFERFEIELKMASETHSSTGQVLLPRSPVEVDRKSIANEFLVDLDLF